MGEQRSRHVYFQDLGADEIAQQGSIYTREMGRHYPSPELIEVSQCGTGYGWPFNLWRCLGTSVSQLLLCPLEDASICDSPTWTGKVENLNISY